MSEFLLLTSPPASGKTYWIESFASDLGNEPLVVISPLRALADECKARWGEKITVMTPEEWLVKSPRTRIVIFDEFHLFFYWGDSFRHRMWECFYSLSQAELVIGLTATVSAEMEKEIRSFPHFDAMIWVDCGNQRLKHRPFRYVKVPDQRFMAELLRARPREGTHLIFCAFRNEVREIGQRLRDAGHTVLECVGGEASEFSRRLASTGAPEFIVATTVLSHGVNLPSIRRIFFTYKVDNLDFWIQMVARGGRKGERFEVYSLEKPAGIPWNRWTNALAVAILSFKLKLAQLQRQTEEWFLKD